MRGIHNLKTFHGRPLLPHISWAIFLLEFFVISPSSYYNILSSHIAHTWICTDTASHCCAAEPCRGSKWAVRQSDRLWRNPQLCLVNKSQIILQARSTHQKCLIELSITSGTHAAKHFKNNTFNINHAGSVSPVCKYLNLAPPPKRNATRSHAPYPCPVAVLNLCSLKNTSIQSYKTTACT